MSERDPIDTNATPSHHEAVFAEDMHSNARFAVSPQGEIVIGEFETPRLSDSPNEIDAGNDSDDPLSFTALAMEIQKARLAGDTEAEERFDEEFTLALMSQAHLHNWSYEEYQEKRDGYFTRANSLSEDENVPEAKPSKDILAEINQLKVVVEEQASQIAQLYQDLEEATKDSEFVPSETKQKKQTEKSKKSKNTEKSSSHGPSGSEQLENALQNLQSLFDPESGKAEDDKKKASKKSSESGENPLNDALEKLKKAAKEGKFTSLNSESTSVDPNTTESPESENLLQTRLDAAREKWATISATRQGRLFDRRIKGYNAAEKEYTEALRAMGKEACKEQLDDPNLSDSERSAIAIKYLMSEQNKLRDLTTEKLNGTKVGKFVTWMNRGNFATRMAKSLGTGAGVGTLGFVLGGPIGAGVLASGAALASRFARGYAVHDKRGTGKLDDSMIKHLSHRANIRSHIFNFNSVADVLDDKFDTDSRHEQTKRRKAVAWGMGTIATGAIFSTILAEAGIQHLPSAIREHLPVAQKSFAHLTHHDLPKTSVAPSGESLPTFTNPSMPEPPVEHFNKPDVLPFTHSTDLPGSDIYSYEPVAYGYDTAPEHVLTQIAHDMGMKIDVTDNRSTDAINALYDKFGANGVFKGAKLYQIGPENIGIADASGKATLTPEAAKFLQDWYRIRA